MKKRTAKFTALALSAAMCLSIGSSAVLAAETENTLVTSAQAIESLSGGITISNDAISTDNYKNTKYNNPVSSEFFCADPTAVEYDGRLYLIGTNDHEQFEAAGPDKDNTYEKIKSMVILSTDDMVNWVYHGEINIGEIAPWIVNSWAPSIASRVEADGLTHFYLYFSNNGLGVGVITTTDLLGTWGDPLGKPLISTSTPGLTDCPNPFDPGVVIDDNGDGWLSFGGGKASDGTEYMPGSSRIVKLGDDMLSFDSDFVEIPAPYFFEASELNYINGTYIYTYNTDWSDHTAQWDYACAAPTGCSMVYMTTKTPLDSDSWEMQGEYFQNPGLAGFDYSNNHTHLQKFNGQYYIFYHTLMLKGGMGITGSYRSLGVDTINVDEEAVIFEKTGGTKKGVSSIDPVDPFTVNLAAALNNTANTSYDTSNMERPLVLSDGSGAWVSVRDVEFTESETTTEEETPITLALTDIDTITYEITVTSIDKDATLSMHPSTKTGADCEGTAEITGTGNYTITCDMNGASGLQNLGYFTISDDATVTFTLDTMTVNGKYDFDMSIELTNTREWADGLKNIWNGFSDGDKVYSSDYAEFRYIKADDAIELFASATTGSSAGADSAPLITTPITFYSNVKGTGRMEIRLDSPTGELLTAINFDTPDAFKTIYTDAVASVGGTHDLYFVFSDADIAFDSWTFATELTDTVVGDVNADGKFTVADIVMMQKYLVRESTLLNWKAGDLCADSGIDAFDLCAMKRALLRITP